MFQLLAKQAEKISNAYFDSVLCNLCFIYRCLLTWSGLLPLKKGHGGCENKPFWSASGETEWCGTFSTQTRRGVWFRLWPNRRCAWGTFAFIFDAWMASKTKQTDPKQCIWIPGTAKMRTVFYHQCINSLCFLGMQPLASFHFVPLIAKEGLSYWFHFIAFSHRLKSD